MNAKNMTTQDIMDLVFSQNGTLTQSQYVDIYDNSPTLKSVFYEEDGKYQFELVFEDKEESILCNVIE